MTAGERRAVAAVLGTLAAVGILMVAATRWWVAPYTVAGGSMEPTLVPGDRVLVDLWAFRRTPPATGDVVVVLTGRGDSLVKRVVTAPPGDREAARSAAVWVRGDNPGASLDSRFLGPVPPDRWVGRVVWRYWPPSRAGPIE